MLHAMETITIFNAFYDADSGLDVWKRAVLACVSWFSRLQTTVAGDGGLLAACEYMVRIPTDTGYLPPTLYVGADGSWTLRPGDVIVHGIAVEENPRPAELKKKYSDVLTVLSVTDNRSGRAPHFKVVGK